MGLIRRTLVSLLVPAATAVIALAPTGLGASFEDVPAAEVRAPGTLERDIATLTEMLSTPEAEARLADAGLTRADVLRRVEKMTPAEVRYLVEQAEAEQKAGGNAVGLVIGILVIILIVVLILVLLDKRVEVRDRSSHFDAGVKTRPEAGSIARGAVIG